LLAHLAATPTVNSSELTPNVAQLQETATNSLDAKELLLLELVAKPISKDQTPDASSLEPPRANVTEAEFANKRKSLWRYDMKKKRLCPTLFSSTLLSYV